MSRQCLGVVPKMGLTNLKKSRLIYLLPSLHLCACVAYAFSEALGHGLDWGFLIIADFPLSIVGAGLLWRTSRLGVPFFFVVGTAWWYLISLALLSLLHVVLRKPQGSKPEMKYKGDEQGAA
jgi:hypothetical protein